MRSLCWRPCRRAASPRRDAVLMHQPRPHPARAHPCLSDANVHACTCASTYIHACATCEHDECTGLTRAPAHPNPTPPLPRAPPHHAAGEYPDPISVLSEHASDRLSTCLIRCCYGNAAAARVAGGEGGEGPEGLVGGAAQSSDEHTPLQTRGRAQTLLHRLYYTDFTTQILLHRLYYEEDTPLQTRGRAQILLHIHYYTDFTTPTLLHRLYYTDFSTKKTLDCRHEVGLFLVMARDRGLRLDTDAHKHCYHI